MEKDMFRRPVLCILAFLCLAVGCENSESRPKGSHSPAKPQDAAASQANNAQKGSRAPFLDQKKQVGPRLEWNREVTSRRGGKILFRVTSQGPFSVTLLTDRGYKAVTSNDPNAMRQEDLLLTIDSKEPQFEKTISLPAGSSWLIIQNQTNQPAEFHLECFDAE